MGTETKKALLEGMSGFLQGAQIGQFNMFVESGAKVVYLEQEVSEEKKKVDCQTLVRCVDRVRELFWGDSSMAVIFCVCRDCFNHEDNMSSFEREFNCSEGLISNTFRNNPYMRLSIDKWKENGAKPRVLQLAGAYINAVNEELKK